MKDFLYLMFGCMLAISCSSAQESSTVMGDGEYFVVFAQPFQEAYQNFELKVFGNTYEKKFKSGEIVKGELQRLSKRNYIFRDNNLRAEHRDSTELQEQLRGLGMQIVELITMDKDTMEFRTTVQANVNVVINKGIIVKKKD